MFVRENCKFLRDYCDRIYRVVHSSLLKIDFERTNFGINLRGLTQ